MNANMTLVGIGLGVFLTAAPTAVQADFTPTRSQYVMLDCETPLPIELAPEMHLKELTEGGHSFIEQASKPTDFAITEQKMDLAWNSAMKILEEKNIDVGSLLSKAGEKLSGWKENPFEGEFPSHLFLEKDGK